MNCRQDGGQTQGQCLGWSRGIYRCSDEFLYITSVPMTYQFHPQLDGAALKDKVVVLTGVSRAERIQTICDHSRIDTLRAP